MKRIIVLILVCTLVAGVCSGCTRRDARGGSSQGKTGSSSVSQSSLKSDKDVKNMTDEDFMAIANDKDEKTTENSNVDLDEELNAIDSILSDNDSMSDIPSNVDIK